MPNLRPGFKWARPCLVAAAVFAASKFAPAKPAVYQTLSLARLQERKRDSCTFVHVWATWCAICIQELGSVIQTLHGIPVLKPVVVDISAPEVQNGFSKKWLPTLHSPFTTFLKPRGHDDAYRKTIDPDWKGELPFSVLYHRGKKKKVWSGTFKLSDLSSEIGAMCRDE